LDTGVVYLSLEPVTRDRSCKSYDGIASVLVQGRSVEFAIEYERTLQSPAKYEKIREAIESEKRVKAFLYLVPNYETAAWDNRRLLTNEATRAVRIG